MCRKFLRLLCTGANAPKKGIENMSGMSPEDERAVKNAIFSARQAVEGAANRTPPGMMQEIQIPSAQVPLPSRGLVYPVDSPLHKQEFVDIKAMTAQEEDILMSRALIKKGTVINELIRSCLLTPGVLVNDMLAGDRNALMVAIRITGYGPEYTPVVQCPSCEQKTEYPIDLSNLDIKPLEIAPVETGVNRFAFRLPVSSREVNFRFLTGKDEEEIAAIVEAKKKKGIAVDSVITTRLISAIVSIDGNTDRNFVAKQIPYLSARDSLALRKYMEKHEPGIDMRCDFECPNCGHSEEVALPMGASFFWPNS
jgi:hypothetical protein